MTTAARRGFRPRPWAEPAPKVKFGHLDLEHLAAGSARTQALVGSGTLERSLV